MSEGWFCKIGEKKVGPLSVQQLKTIAARGQLRAEHLVRRGDAGPWVPAGRVKGLFPEKPNGAAASAAKPAQAKPLAQPGALPVAHATPAKAASELPPELSLGAGGHKHHVALNVDQLDIDAEPVMVSTRKTRGVAGLKKDEQRKLTMILLGVIGGGLLIALILLIWAGSQGYFSSPHKEEAKKEESKTEEPESAKKTAKTEEKAAEKEDDKWIKFPESLRLKKLEVKLVDPTLAAPPEGSEIDRSEHDTVLVLPVRMVLKLGVEDAVDYAGWGESELKNISLKDDTKRAYKLLDLSVEPKDRKAVERGKPVTARLVFEPPLNKAKYVRLEMPATAIGEQGMLKFQIACTKIAGSREAGPKKIAAQDADDAKSKGKTKKKAKAPPAETEEEPAESPPPKRKSPAKTKPAAAETAQDDGPPPPVKRKPAPTPKTTAPDDDTAKIDLPLWAKKPKTEKKQGLDMSDEK